MSVDQYNGDRRRVCNRRNVSFFLSSKLKKRKEELQPKRNFLGIFFESWMAPSVVVGQRGKQQQLHGVSSVPATTTTAAAAAAADIDALGSPFPPLKVEFSEDEWRETAYEILMACCGLAAMSARSSTPKLQTQKSLTSAAASHMKKALGLQGATAATTTRELSQRALSFKSNKKTPSTVTEIMKVQLRISDQSEVRTLRALSRAAAGQASKSSGMVIVPLELLQNIGSSAFTDDAGFKKWLKRQLKVLEAGLLAHPLVPGDMGMDSLRLKQTLKDLYDKPAEVGKNSETLQVLRGAAMSRATRALNGEYGDFLHWADGIPLNVHLYETLLHACFLDNTLDNNEEGGVVIEELDEVLELIKKTWVMLGINQMMHNLCFMWVFFRQFVDTGQGRLGLLTACETQMIEVAKDAKARTLQSEHVELLSTTLSAIQSWVERRLLAYHDSFPGGAEGVMTGLLSLAVACTQISHDDISREYRHRRKDNSNVALNRVDVYIRSSIRTAFAQMMETVDKRRRSFKGSAIGGGSPPPALVILAQDTSTLALNEVENFSPVLKRWHPYAAGVAAATLHACYRREFKQYLSGVTAMVVDTLAILKVADGLEKHLVQIAVEDGVECEDGGKGLIQEMPPFEADQAMADLSKKWVFDNLNRITDWVNRNIQQENWKPAANRDRCAASSVDVLRILEETLDAFFSLSLENPELLATLVNGLDKALQHCITQTVNPCGTKDLHVPSLPKLTRCSVNKSWLGGGGGVHKSKSKTEGSHGGRQGRLKTANGEDPFSLAYLCVRINTVSHINTELDAIEKKIRHGWKDEATIVAPPLIGSGKKKTKAQQQQQPVPPTLPQALLIEDTFQRTRRASKEGIQQLIELAAHRVVFSDLRSVFGEGLYIGGVTNARISTVLEQLDTKLGIIAETTAEHLRNRLAIALMQTCFDGFLIVLLAGGPLRTFMVSDSDLLKEDLEAMKDLFLADGNGLPSETVARASARASQVLTLFDLSSNELIHILSASSFGDTAAAASKHRSGNTNTKSSYPPTTGNWSASDANTVLRVLCYRYDETASQFLKKTYNLPKKLHD